MASLGVTASRWPRKKVVNSLLSTAKTRVQGQLIVRKSRISTRRGLFQPLQVDALWMHEECYQKPGCLVVGSFGVSGMVDAEVWEDYKLEQRVLSHGWA